MRVIRPASFAQPKKTVMLNRMINLSAFKFSAWVLIITLLSLVEMVNV